MNFDFITERLATGSGIETTEDVARLVAVGITHIVNCRDDFDDLPLLNGVNVAYLWNPTADDGQPKPAVWFLRSVAFAMPALARPGVKVYCHCKDGINRGPSTVYAIMRAWGILKLTAKAMIDEARIVDLVGIRYADDADAAISQWEKQP